MGKIIILLLTIILFLFLKMANVLVGVNIGITIFFFLTSWFNFIETPLAFYERIKFQLKNLIKKEDFLIKVRINGIVLATVVPYKLKRKFIEKFGKDNLVIEREELDLFFQQNLSNGELIELELKKKMETDKILMKSSIRLSENFLSQKDRTFHISYYEKGGNLKVINTIKEKPITENDVTSFRSFIQTNLKKGDKVMEHHFKKWSQTLLNKN